ncbi:MAG: GntR family transcriptional regulator [Bacillota bacterium]|jgi:GntR family transcriptional regulator|nr:GntR family transcriptional regulator [Bacillota bacterium]
MLVSVDFQSEIPLYMQLRNQVVIGIAQGKLAPGEQLPTIRALAEESGINMMTVSKAYQLLKQEGYVRTDRRSGTIVAPHQKAVLSEDRIASLRLVLSELRIAGMSEEEVLALCRELYREVGK